jgi:hypothetical protein
LNWIWKWRRRCGGFEILFVHKSVCTIVSMTIGYRLISGPFYQRIPEHSLDFFSAAILHNSAASLGFFALMPNALRTPEKQIGEELA